VHICYLIDFERAAYLQFAYQLLGTGRLTFFLQHFQTFSVQADVLLAKADGLQGLVFFSLFLFVQ
jgi:hypothetical protein